MFMHYHALHLSFPSFLSFVFYYVFLLFSYPLSFLTMAPKKSIPSLFVLDNLGSVMRTPKRISLRTFVIGRFIRNAKSFYLIS